MILNYKKGPLITMESASSLSKRICNFFLETKMKELLLKEVSIIVDLKRKKKKLLSSVCHCMGDDTLS